MPYNPGVVPQSGQIIMEGLQQGQQAAQMWGQLASYLLNRSNQAGQDRTTLESLANYPGGQASTPAAPGFNPMAPGQESAPANGAEDQPDPLAQRGAQAEAIRKLVQSYAPAAKDLHQGLKSMSLSQLEGMLKAYTIRQTADEHAARMEDFQAHAQLRKQQALDDATVGTAAQAFATYKPEDGSVPTMQDRLSYALSKVPAAGGRVLPQLISSLAKYGEAAAPEQELATSSYEDPVTHQRFVQRGKQIMSAGFNPAAASATIPEPLISPVDQSLLGFIHRDPRGKETFIKPPAGAMLKQAVNERGQPVPGYLVDAQGKPHDTRSVLEKALGPQASDKASSAAAASADYQSAGEVRAAVLNGKLDKAAGLKLLREKFGYK